MAAQAANIFTNLPLSRRPLFFGIVVCAFPLAAINQRSGGTMNLEEAKQNLRMAKHQDNLAEQYYWEAKNWDRNDMKQQYYEKEREARDYAKYLRERITEAGYKIEDLEK